MRATLRWFIVVALVAFGAFAMLSAAPRADQLTADVLVGR